MPLVDLGPIRSRQHNDVEVRWNDETGAVQVRMYRYPLKDDPHWAWISVGIADSVASALMTATNYLRVD